MQCASMEPNFGSIVVPQNSARRFVVPQNSAWRVKKIQNFRISFYAILKMCTADFAQIFLCQIGSLVAHKSVKIFCF